MFLAGVDKSDLLVPELSTPTIPIRAIGLPGSLPAMYTPPILQRLYLLDTSSPDFLRHLYCLVRYDEKEQYLTSLRGSELTRLVDFLEKVHIVSSAFHRSSVYQTDSTGP